MGASGTAYLTLYHCCTKMLANTELGDGPSDPVHGKLHVDHQPYTRGSYCIDWFHACVQKIVIKKRVKGRGHNVEQLINTDT